MHIVKRRCRCVKRQEHRVGAVRDDLYVAACSVNQLFHILSVLLAAGHQLIVNQSTSEEAIVVNATSLPDRRNRFRVDTNHDSI